MSEDRRKGKRMISKYKKSVLAILCVSMLMTSGCGNSRSGQSKADNNPKTNHYEEGIDSFDSWIDDDELSNCLRMELTPDNCEMTMSGNQVTMLTASNGNGGTVRVKCEGITVSDDGQYFVFGSEAEMITLDSLGGIKHVIPTLQEGTDPLIIEGMFSASGLTSVEKETQLSHRGGGWAEYEWPDVSMSTLANFLKCYTLCGSEVKVSKLDIYYLGTYTQVGEFYLNRDFYQYYFPGDIYDPSREVYDEDNLIFDFYVNAKIDSPYVSPYDDIYGIRNVTAGDLHRADGSVKDKSEPLEVGDYLDFVLDGETFSLQTFVLDGPTHAQTFYEMAEYAAAEALGDLHVVVLPILFADQEWTAEDEAELQSLLGRVADENGVITEFPALGDQESLSSFFEKASYGQLHIDSFIAKPMEMKEICGEDCTFAYGRDYTANDEFMVAWADWLNDNCSDPAYFDRDGNGLYDVVVIVNPGDMNGFNDYERASMAYAVEYRQYYGPELARTGKNRGINYVPYCTLGAIHEGVVRGVEDYDTTAFLHEFSHALGVMDYYDVGFYASAPFGGFDLLDGNVGDWNAYSKYAAGWITPEIVLPSEIDEKGTIEITIDAFETNGSCILIPTVGSEQSGIADIPFCEGILVDLFTDEGLYHQGAERFGLSGVSGVRICHLDGRYETYTSHTMDDYVYEYATPHTINAYTDSHKYHLSLMQASGEHYLVEPDCEKQMCKEDLFMAGDSFSVGRYGYYFADGLMNDSTEFPYIITVKSIKDGKAVIEISK